jgi:NTP pyrophosphatase (non-canonical NTP hydrolase)
MTGTTTVLKQKRRSIKLLRCTTRLMSTVSKTKSNTTETAIAIYFSPTTGDGMDNEDEYFGMTFEEYQDIALEFVVYPDQHDVIYPALKLAGEAGEVAEKVGKRLRDAGGDFAELEWREAMKKELGDVLWYISALADDLGYTLEEVADTNLSKLSSRAARGVLGGSGDDR